MIRVFSILLISMLPLRAAGPGASNDFLGKRVLIIGIDGLRPDALQAAVAPRIRELMKSGVTTLTAVSGGALEGPTQQPTISGPGWTSMLTGTYANVHGVLGNAKAVVDGPGGYQVTAAPHFAKRLKERFPAAVMGSVVSWDWIEDYLVAAQADCFDFHTKGLGGNYPARDRDVCGKAVAYLKESNPDVLFVHFDQVDGAGHATGFDLGNEAYLAAIAAVDAYVGELMQGIAARPMAAAEDWMVILTTDHGGTVAGTHGGQTPEERTIPIIVSSKEVAQDQIDPATPGIHVIPAIVFHHLGIKVDPAWNWQPGIFGFTDPGTAAVSKE